MCVLSVYVVLKKSRGRRQARPRRARGEAADRSGKVQNKDLLDEKSKEPLQDTSNMGV